MLALPGLDLFYKLEEFAVDGDKARDDLSRSFDLVGIVRTEDDGEGWLRYAFQHVLALFVEACGDHVVLLEDD